jgi:hypothetical protein
MRYLKAEKLICFQKLSGTKKSEMVILLLQNLGKILEFSQKLTSEARDIIKKFSDKANEHKKVPVGSEYIFIMLE